MYWGSHQLCIRLQIEVGVCAVPTADVVATDEVSCYDVIVQLRSLPRFGQAINQGMYHNDTWLVRMFQSKQNDYVLIF